jgi:hypothetical protein
MILHIKKAVAEKIGIKKFEAFGLDAKAWSWRELAELNLARFPLKRIETLNTLLLAHKAVHGVGVLLRDIATWTAALNDAGSVKARTVKQFCPLLRGYMLPVPGHRVYHRTADNVWLPFYVDEITFHPEERHHGYTPPRVTMDLIWLEFGGKKKEVIRFEESDCRGITVAEALARQGYIPETPALRAAYLAEVERFGQITGQLGKQFLAVGTGKDDLDGNKRDSRDSSWYWNKVHDVQLENEGQPTRVVVDVFYEDAKTDRSEDNRIRVNTWFWSNVEFGKVAGDEDDTEDEDNEDDAPKRTKKVRRNALDEDNVEEPPEIEIPIHPFAAVFDLTKHLRLRVHVNYLTEYVYDTKLADKLVLAPELKKLVLMLIEHKAVGFQDIIKGKAGGAVVLLAGAPGTGKTLTAEVYAESEQRALYSIQCSQLGTDPDELEDELLKAFARARRWGAIMLLDEADVYVHERGRDLQQNAIVGVFLRVLEYQNSVLFLTTNRPDDVDDAIGSRCVARLVYRTPTALEQSKIWRVLADGAGAQLTDAAIVTIVEKSPKLTGRDVKNLLKLAMLIKPGAPVAPDTVEYVKRFKPTGTTKKEETP